MVSALRIESVILHGIRKRIRSEDVEPDLTDAESELSERIRAFLQEQVRAALKFGREIVEEPGLSTLPDHVRAFWAGDSDLLETSRALAISLQSNQPTQAPEGLLMVADALADEQRVFVIAKLEHERGAQAQREENEEGRLVYNMRFLDDLFFTTGSKVFKIGYFPVSAELTAPIEGLVVDRQVQAHHVARYFREVYLGCDWKEKPELITEKFYDSVQAWIDHLEDPEKRARYQVGLLAEMQSQSTGLSVSRFAQSHLDVDDRDPFIAHAQQTLPMREVTKSIEFVKSRLNNVRLDTDSGAIVMAPPDRLQDGTVEVEDADGSGDTRIIVNSRITKTSGSGTFRRDG